MWLKILSGILLIFIVVGLVLFLTLKYVNQGWDFVIWLMVISGIQIIVARFIIQQRK